MDSEQANNYIWEKQIAIVNIVNAAIAERRHELGLCQMLTNSTLGKSALDMSEMLLTMKDPDNDEMSADYDNRVKLNGYQGVAHVAHYRRIWPLDCNNEVIAHDMLNIFLEASTREGYEDWGVGISRGFDPERPTIFCMSVVYGYGWLDGNGRVTEYINEARSKAETEPLKVDYHLRRLARDYLALDKDPDPDRVTRDVLQSGYAEEEGSTVRYDYGGIYAQIPGGVNSPTTVDVARLVADEFLVQRETLLRSDWQDVGFAIGQKPVLPPIGYGLSPRVPSIEANYFIAWSLSPGVERPAHFPQKQPDDRQLYEKPRKRRRWWPFYNRGIFYAVDSSCSNQTICYEYSLLTLQTLHNEKGWRKNGL